MGVLGSRWAFIRYNLQTFVGSGKELLFEGGVDGIVGAKGGFAVSELLS